VSAGAVPVAGGAIVGGGEEGLGSGDVAEVADAFEFPGGVEDFVGEDGLQEGIGAGGGEDVLADGVEGGLFAVGDYGINSIRIFGHLRVNSFPGRDGADWPSALFIQGNSTLLYQYTGVVKSVFVKGLIFKFYFYSLF
jgi:hypothetical protein